MKRTAVPLFALAVAAFGADPVIGTIAVSPTFAPANTPTQIEVTALITDASLIAGGANVQRLNSAGVATRVLGILHDDGLSGDAAAGDHIYTLVFTLNEANPGRISFRASGAFQGVLQRVPSSSIAVDVANTASPLSIDTTAAPVPNAADWNRQDVTVTYACAGGAGGSESCPGIVRVTTEGADQVISGTAQDGAGNTASKSVTINLDKTVPVLNVTFPSNGATVNATPLTLTGTVSDSISGVAAVNCNGQAATVTAPAFSCIVPLVLGSNAISVQATDVAGNVATSNLSAVLVLSNLTMTAAASPAANAAGWNNTDVTVTFTCAGGTAPVTCPAPVVVSTEGANQSVSRTVTDGAGNTASASVTLKIDKTKPAVGIGSPTPGSTVTGSPLTVTGTATDSPSGIGNVSCNGTAAVLTAPNYSCSVPLTPGLNTIAAVAADVAGNTAAASVSVTFTPSTPPPTITDFNPKSGPIGTLVTVAGSNLAPVGATSAQVSMSKQGGGTIAAPVASTTAAQLTFTVPAGGSTGLIGVTVNSGSATTTDPFTVTSTSDFTMTVAPASVDLIQGQSVSLAVKLASSNAFGQLAALSVSGLPTGVTATLKPTQITAGQTSLLTLTAPASQSIGSSALTITAAATVEGIPVSQSANATLNVVTPTTSFIARSVVADALQAPIAGVTVKMLGQNGSGGATGCTGTAVSDAAGNIALRNLPPSCVGPQLIGFDGTTATSPTGKYAGVNVTYTLTSGQVKAAPLLVNLPRIDDKEVFLVQQNSANDQSYSYKTVPGLAVTVYKGTTFTMPDGSQPNPFPLAGIQVPIDRLPDVKPPVPTMVMGFIVAFQPANANASQPVAVYYPNTIKTPPGVNMTLMTLDPTRGTMVPYGTGTVASDGIQIVPDPIPSGGGKRYGIVHFDWHSPMPPPSPPTSSPPPTPPCGAGMCCGSPTTGQPVQLGSGVDLYQKTDISFGGTRGTVSIVRTYRTLTTNSGPFGIGGNHNYGYSLDSLTPQTASLINLIAPDYNFFPFSQQPNGALINTTDPAMLGAVMTVAADNSVSLRWKDGTVYQFNPPSSVFPLLRSIIDPNGNVISLTRNSARPTQITQITDPVGRSLVLTYDAQDRITSITDPIGRQVLYTYNSLGALASVTDPAGGVTKYDYQSATLLFRETDARNIVVTENTFGANGRVIQQKQADGGIIKISYTLANPLAPTSPVIQAVVTDPLSRQTTYRFSTTNYVTDSTDAFGHARVFEHSGANLVTAIKGDGGAAGCGNPAVGDTAFSYDTVTGNILSQVDALGNSALSRNL